MLTINSPNEFVQKTRYNVFEGGSVQASFFLTGPLRGELRVDDRYYIRSESKSASRQAVITFDGEIIAVIRYRGWTWNNHKLIVKDGDKHVTWTFTRKERNFFRRPRTTDMYLTTDDRQIHYTTTEKDYRKTISDTGIPIDLEGKASFLEKDRIACLLGFFIIDYLRFTDSD